MESIRGHTPQVIRTRDLKPYPNSLQPDFYLPTEEDAKHRIRNDSTDSMISTYLTTGLTVSSCAFRCLLVATIATLIMAVVSCALAVQLWFRCDEMETRLSATKTEVDASKDMATLCLPCEELVQVSLEEDKLGLEILDRQTENNTDICCATTSQQTLTLLNLYVARRRIVTEVTETQNNVGCNCSNGTVPKVTSSTNGRVSAHLLVGAYTTKRSSGVYGAPCYYDSDCNPTETNLQCSEGRCKCKEFYNRVPDTRFCAASCDVYGDTFECYADMCLLFNNIEDYTFTDMSECQALCSSDSRCRSLDWIEDSQECFLSDLTLYDYPENKEVSAIDTYCQRNCQ